MLRTEAVLFLLALGAACGPAPVPLENPPPTSMRTGQLPPGHPPLDGGAGGPTLGTPAGAQPVPADVRFAGVVRIQGALAQTEQGFVFVSIKPRGINMPSLSRKYALSEAQPGEGGERRLVFDLDESDMMGGLAPGDLVLEARFDPDGFVESKDGVVVATVPIELGASGAEIVLGG